MDEDAYWAAARESQGSAVEHVSVIWSLQQMRVQLADGTRLLLDRFGQQIGRSLPPAG